MQKSAVLVEHRRGTINQATYELGMQDDKAARTVQIPEQRLDERKWNYQVRTSTTKIHLAANYVFMMNCEIAKKLIKQHPLKCHEKWICEMHVGSKFA